MPLTSKSTAGARNVHVFLGLLIWSELGRDYLRRSVDSYNFIVNGTNGVL